jgi:hypothetical protein
MMGQQQIVAEQGGGAVRRIMLVVLVAALMALIMVVTAAPALAANGSFTEGAKNAAVKSNGKALNGVNTAALNHFRNN